MKAAFGAIQTRVPQMLWLDPGEASYAAKVTVWLRWLFWIGAVIELAYRPTFTQAKYIPFMLMHVLVGGRETTTQGHQSGTEPLLDGLDAVQVIQSPL